MNCPAIQHENATGGHVALHRNKPRNIHSLNASLTPVCCAPDQTRPHSLTHTLLQLVFHMSEKVQSDILLSLCGKLFYKFDSHKIFKLIQIDHL